MYALGSSIARCGACDWVLEIGAGGGEGARYESRGACEGGLEVGGGGADIGGANEGGDGAR